MDRWIKLTGYRKEEIEKSHYLDRPLAGNSRTADGTLCLSVDQVAGIKNDMYELHFFGVGF